MRSITISEPVWLAIAGLGKFGETEDDVLRRVFRLPSASEQNSNAASATHPIASARPRQSPSAPRRSFATNRMSSYISGNELRIEFASGPRDSWRLPSRSDKETLRAIRKKATDFAERNGATLGQVNAVRKTLTDAGYHLLK